MVISLREARIKESDEVRPGVIIDIGHDDDMVGLEILNASKRVEDPLSITVITTIIVLSPSNPAYSPIILSKSEAEFVRVVGEFVTVLRGI